MSPILLVVLGFVTASLVAALVWIGALFMAPHDKARRAALAALIGGTVGFTTTALVQGPFYDNAKMAASLEPFILSAITGAGMALLAAWMILKTKTPN